MRNVWLALVLSVAGCNGKDTGHTGNPHDTVDTTDADTDTDAPVVCADLGVGDPQHPTADICDEQPACKSIKGFPVIADTTNPGGYCVDNSALPNRLGCTQHSRQCDGGDPVWGRPPQAPDTVCFRVLGHCPPRDFVPCVHALEVTNFCPTG